MKDGEPDEREKQCMSVVSDDGERGNRGKPETEEKNNRVWK